jgi:hypothetical protein
MYIATVSKVGMSIFRIVLWLDAHLDSRIAILFGYTLLPLVGRPKPLHILDQLLIYAGDIPKPLAGVFLQCLPFSAANLELQRRFDTVYNLC